MKKIFSICCVIALAAMPASSYLFDYSSSGQIESWPQAVPIVWHLNPAQGSNITGTRTLDQVANAAFATWENAPNTAFTVTEGATTSNVVATPSQSGDTVNELCFDSSCVGSNTFSQGVLAFTIVRASGTTIVESDTLFNPAVNFTTSCVQSGQAWTGLTDNGLCPTAGSSTNDLQTVLTHELGHFLGLDHSAVIRSEMFPFSPNVEQALSYDDVAAIAALYPKTVPDTPTGSISGAATLGGSGVFGAHVFALSNTSNLAYTGAAGLGVRKSAIGTLTKPDGTYTIVNVPPDTYIVGAEPLDGPVANSDVADYPPSFGKTAVQTNFTTRWH